MSAGSAQHTDEQSFTCDACGRKFRWKAELAGRKARCKCGGVIEIPLQPPTIRRAYVDPTIVVTPGDPLAPTDLLTGNQAGPAGVDSQVETPPAPRSVPVSVAVSSHASTESGKGLEAGKGAIGTIVVGAIFVGLGVWQLVDPHDPADSGGGRRLLRTVLGWVYSLGGNIGVVVLLVGLGLLLIGSGVYSMRRRAHSS